MLCDFLVSFFFFFVTCNGLVSYDLDIKGDSQNGYYISAFVGTPPQRINFLVDTGSSNLAVAAVRQRKERTQYFVYNESSTFRPSDIAVRLRYVQGDWSGFLASDVFNPCLEYDCSITCNISCMTTMRDIFENDSMFQGIMGLAYSSIANPSPLARPFFDVFKQEKNTSNVFSLLLCGPFFSSKEQSTACGKFHIGYSEEYVDSDIMYTPIVHEWFYEVTIVDLKVGIRSSPVKCHDLNQNKSIIDSGTSDLNVPPAVYEWLISEIHNHVSTTILNEFWMNETVICMQSKSVNASLFPAITIDLYHSKNEYFYIHISPELYVLPLASSTDTCVKLGIGISNYGVVLGSTILKGFYVIFDRESKRVGFAKSTIIPHIGFVSDVSNLLVSDMDFDHCIRNVPVSDTTISPLVILGLIGICVIAVLFLYALLSWIWKVHIIGRDDSSDTSSLVDDD